jgi:hypothetical protein
VIRPLLVGSVALAISGYGCGAEDDALDQTREIESYRYAFAVDGDLAGQRIRSRGEGTSNADATRSRFTASLIEGDGSPLEFEAVAIDEDMYGLPARVAAELKAAGRSGSVRLTTDVLAYDVPVDATEPPAASVATASDIERGG